MSYRTAVFGGVIAGVSAAAFFAESLLLWIAIAAFAIAMALLLAALTKVLFGIERFSFLHYQAATLASTAALLSAMHAPVLPAMELLALALAIAQGIGRIGCAYAGCCHGRPFRVGLRYERGRVAAHFAGARLVPVQWLESVALLLLATAVALTIGRGAFVVYVSSYAVLRFALELLRGDRRPHFAGLSEAQWICVVTAIVFAPVAIKLLLALAAVVVMRMRRIDVDAFARALHAVRETNELERVHGLRISHGRTGEAEFYTLSSVAPERARALAELVRDLAHPDRRVQCVTRDGGLLHIIVGGAA
ncbi:MAG TPA: prolipoprotein diacylglyceryl transferase family protein [Thermoanaerobaculia bacterium]|nr:prolipoprotein diacylglyceryl transferase family protein [Thermoanaerobaculia bacterium]